MSFCFFSHYLFSLSSSLPHFTLSLSLSLFFSLFFTFFSLSFYALSLSLSVLCACNFPSNERKQRLCKKEATVKSTCFQTKKDPYLTSQLKTWLITLSINQFWLVTLKKSSVIEMYPNRNKETVDEACMRRTTDNLRSLCCINNNSFGTILSHCDAQEFPEVNCDEVYPGIYLGNEWVHNYFSIFIVFVMVTLDLKGVYNHTYSSAKPVHKSAADV